MNELIKKLELIVDKKADNHEIKQELSSLVKMLKTGFESKNVGMEKVPKLFASNDAKKIQKFYDMIGNQVNALKVSGNFDRFATYLSTNFGIKVSFTSETAPNIRFMKTGKKFIKFTDLYSQYFLEDVPQSATKAVEKILNSLDKLTKEYNTENDDVKEQIKTIIENENEHSATTVKTMDKILTSARIKSISSSDVADNEESKLSDQLQGVELIRKGNSNDSN